jgi:hypothetical protein
LTLGKFNTIRGVETDMKCVVDDVQTFDAEGRKLSQTNAESISEIFLKRLCAIQSTFECQGW